MIFDDRNMSGQKDAGRLLGSIGSAIDGCSLHRDVEISA